MDIEGGITFLFLYGLKAFASAASPGGLVPDGDDCDTSALGKMILTTLMLSLLNPHAFLDTVVLLGSLAGTTQERPVYYSPWAQC